MNTRHTAVLGLLLAPAVTAQVTVSATATDFTVTAVNTSSTTGPLTDPTILSQGTVGPVSGTTVLRYEVDESNYPDTVVVSLLGQINITNSAGTLFPFTLSQSADVSVTIASPTATLVDIDVNFDYFDLANGGSPSLSSSADIGGLAVVAPNDPTTTFRVPVDAGGVAVDFDLTHAFPPSIPTFGSMQTSLVLLELTLRPAEVATPYGAPCNGASLDFTAALDAPPTVTASDPGALFGVLLIGSQELDIPLVNITGFPWPCPLRTDIAVSIPVDVGPPTGSFSFPFVTPPGSVRMQLLTSDGASVNTSNGLHFVR